MPDDPGMIFEVAAPFQMQPCNRIKLPAAKEDYVAREKSAVDTSQRGLRQHADVEALLEALEPRLRDRWVGAWQALDSDNADGVSQAANSMVEVLDKVIGKVVGEQTFEEYLNSRFPTQGRPSREGTPRESARRRSHRPGGRRWPKRK